MTSKSRSDKGNVVMVDVPYLDASRSVRRPALVISDSGQTLDVVIAAITSRIRDPLPPAHYLLNHRHPDWKSSGLRLDSVVRCDRLFTIHDSQIMKTIGSLSDPTLAKIDELLKRVLKIS